MEARSNRFDAMKRVTLIGAVINLLLTVGKIVLGNVAHSQALIADGVHSLSDLVTDVLVLVASWHGSKEADTDHPYGHARFETLATVILGVLLLAVALGIAWDALERIGDMENLVPPGVLALAMAVVSILSKEALFHYTILVARKTRSEMLRANAWHHRSDAISSVIVVLGVAGAMAGLPWLDGAAAIAVAGMIAWIGVQQVRGSVRELVDTGVPEEDLAAIREVIMAVDGVESLHLLKTRHMGSDVLVDVHILLRDDRVSVSEGHQISEIVRNRLIRKLDDVLDVMVHIDPEDDEKGTPNAGLPTREQVLELLEVYWRGIDGWSRDRRITLHYLNGRVHLDVVLPFAVLDDVPDAGPALERRMRQAVAADARFGRITVLFGCSADSQGLT